MREYMDMFSEPDGRYTDSPTQNIDMNDITGGSGSFLVNSFWHLL